MDAIVNHLASKRVVIVVVTCNILITKCWTDNYLVICENGDFPLVGEGNGTPGTFCV
jgi:hypothetical protein